VEPILIVVLVSLGVAVLVAAWASISGASGFLSALLGTSITCTAIGLGLFALVKLVKWMWTA
jgi:hypothetical protein